MPGLKDLFYPADAKSDPRNRTTPSATGSDGGKRPPTAALTAKGMPEPFDWSGHEKLLRDQLGDPRLRSLDRKRLEEILTAIVWLKEHPQAGLIRELRSTPPTEESTSHHWIG